MLLLLLLLPAVLLLQLPVVPPVGLDRFWVNDLLGMHH
jgi:hypothetical protein